MKDNQKLEKFSNFVIFQSATGKVNIDVYFQNEILWLTQKKMAELFEVKVPAISRHLKNIFEVNELQENSVISILETTAPNFLGSPNSSVKIHQSTPSHTGIEATAQRIQC